MVAESVHERVKQAPRREVEEKASLWVVSGTAMDSRMMRKI